MNLKTLLFTIIVCAFMIGCSSSEQIKMMSAEERFNQAKKEFDEGDYLKAIQDFKVITIEYRGTTFAHQAQFYIAESHFKREEFRLAAFEYTELMRSYPTTEKVCEARYKLALCYYNLSPKSELDQQSTFSAIESFQGFIEYCPTSPLRMEADAKIRDLINKLAKKEYETGLLYMKREEYKASLIYFDGVLEQYHDSDYADDAQLKKAEAQLLRKRYREAKTEIDKFFAKYPGSSLKSEAENLRKEIEGKLNLQVRESDAKSGSDVLQRRSSAGEKATNKQQ
jgi:outer membrane protein assembly factor BamD